MDIVHKAACHNMAASRPHSALQLRQQLLVAPTNHSNLKTHNEAMESLDLEPRLECHTRELLLAGGWLVPLSILAAVRQVAGEWRMS